MKIYVITGATSMLGSTLVNELSRDNIVYAVIRPNSINTSNLILNDNVKCIYSDMDHYKTIKLDIDKIDGVFHFAWEGARNPYRNNEKMQENNYINSVDLYNSLIKYKPNFIFGAGSQGEYGEYDCAYSENLECKPTTQYGIYKNKYQKFLEYNCKKDNVIWIWGRVFSAYGKGDYKNTLIMSSIDKLIKNEDLNLSPCEHIWNFTYKKDIIKAILMLINKKCSGIYNITNSDNIPLKIYIEKLKSIFNSKSTINYGYIPYSGRVPNMIADNNKLVKDTGYNPEYSFEAGIKDMMED